MNVFQVEQKLVSAPLRDVGREVHRVLDKMGKEPPRGEIAITAGSRGISNLVAITKAAGEWLRAHGAQPFLVPAMGSHNGATAEGQQKMVESLGLTSAATGLEIRSSMDCIKLGTVDSGDVWMDRHCHASAGVLVLNRIKLHTCFSGPVQSGLTKMMVVGMGKIRSAETFHSARPDRMPRILEEMGSLLIQSGKIFAGLAILEDGFDETAEIHALPGDEILPGEPALLERHRHYFPALPCRELDVLVVDEIGKTFSGTGMDTNVIGRRGVHGYEDLTEPRIKIIAALGLSEHARGNALGVGLSDFITRRLRDSIDEQKTFVNAFTTGDMQRMAIPCTLQDDAALFQKIRERFGERRWMLIPNTLHLGRIFVSHDLVKELQNHPRCRVSSTPTPLTFSDGRLTLFR
ncbi:MAG: DUF2088 domain-containing protein [Verrucomicrobia bacterium]|nr:DUF2088 domain-containing protein [Pseudomonadota bacterium]NBS49423.1 DUF2088 domain-containing protein [Verrucomicrobiota bacterium]NBS78900.1 DUF2088 domain-containing protein [bacterium]NBT23585.1 DUF2088 domain-containing protein [bacterium]NBV96333.1 DUF2088 domain-containing protein [Verrucomicrobiota bacterium]